MRILLAVHTFFPNWRAGTEVYALNIARTLRKLGHQVQVVCYEPAAHFTAYVTGVDEFYEGLPVHRIYFNPNQPNRLLHEYFNSHIEKYLIDFYRRVRPDVVHVLHAMHLSAATITAAKQVGLPVVCTATDFWYICPTYRLLRVDNSICPGPVNFLQCMRCYALPNRKWDRAFASVARSEVLVRALGSACDFASHVPGLRSTSKLRQLQNVIARPRRLREILELVDVLIVPTQNTYRVLTQNGIKAKRFLILEYGLSLPPGIRTAKTPSQKLRIGYIGTLEYAKGPHILLRAFESLSKQENLELVVYGDRRTHPDYFAHLQRIASSDRRIRFAEPFPNELIGSILSNIDLLVIPSIWYENAPLVLYSAFATKTPVVVSNTGSLVDVVCHGRSGLVFEVGNAEDLARQIELVLEDPSLLEKLRQGIPAVKSIDQNVSELLEIYATLSAHPSLTRPALDCSSLLKWLESARREIQPSGAPIAFWERARIRSLFKKRGARFGDNLELCRCQYVVESDRRIDLRFVWRVLHPLERNLKVMVELLDENDNDICKLDHQMDEFVGSNGSSAQGFAAYSTSLHTPRPLARGSYSIRVALWDSARAVTVPPTSVWGWQEDKSHSIRLRSVHVP
jgi:glycosyltransferase involved in cell wall biosynthesis